MFSADPFEKPAHFPPVAHWVNRSYAIAEKIKITLGKLNATSLIKKLLARGFGP